MQRRFPWRAPFLHYFQNADTRCNTPKFLARAISRRNDHCSQHQFWNLQVKQAHFEVELSFNDKRENLVIPFKSITGFADPSVKFGLQFDENIKADLTSDEKNDANELAVTAQYLDEKAKILAK